MLSRRFISAVILSAPLFAGYCFAQTSPSNQFITVKNNSTNGTPVAVADFNGDGKPDVLVSGSFYNGVNNFTTVSLAVLLNNGNGTFTTTPITSSPLALYDPIGPFYAVADVNGDGIPDIIVSDPIYTCGSTGPCDYTGGAIYVLFGEGNGSFDSPQIYGSSQGIFVPSSFAVADVNNDGYPDLVVLTAPQSTASAPYGKVQVLLNDGHGSFTKGSSFTSPLAQIYGTGDFTNDGRKDVVGVTALSSNYTQTLQILKNLGNGSPQVAAQDSEPAIAGVGISDLNQDGHADLILTGTTRATVLLGNGDYTFHASSDLLLPLASGIPAKSVPVPTPVVAGDFNHDGHLDFITGQQVFFGDGHGNFTASKIYSPGYSVLTSDDPQHPSPGYTGALFAADFNGDGNLDLIGASDYNVVLWLGNPNGIFTAPYQTLTAPGNAYMVTADFNRDGISDLAVFDRLMYIYPGTGKSYFDPPKAFKLVSGGPIVGDINNDGYPDVVVVADPTVTVYLGKPGFTFAAPKTYTFSFPTGDFEYLVDVNHDGNLDLVGGGGVLLGNGDGTFQTTLHPLPALGTPSPYYIASMAFGDFNGDGKIDIAELSTAQYSSMPVTLNLLLGNGDGTFSLLSSTPEASLNLSSFGGGIALADLNHDGHLDLIYTGTGTGIADDGELLVQLGNGKGSFAAPIRETITSAAMNTGNVDRSLLLADFDRDGNLDAVVPTNGGFIEYLRGLGNGTFAAPASYMIDSENSLIYEDSYSGAPNYSYYAVTDINGDGYPDILKTLVTSYKTATEGAITRLINSGAHTTPPK